MLENALSKTGMVLVVVSIIMGSGCSSTFKTKASHAGGNDSQINIQKTKETSLKMPVKYDVLSVNKTKDKQPFLYSVNRPIENKDPKERHSFLIVAFEVTNPNSFKISEHFKKNDFQLLSNGVLSSADPYEWWGGNQILMDAENMVRINTGTGYWCEFFGSNNNLAGNQTRNKKMMFEILDNSGEQIVLLIKGKQYSLK
jgi:hypothetical protein